MYFLSKFCGACLENNTNLSCVPKTSDINSKLSQCFKEVDWSCVQQFYICTSCEKKLDIAFEFRQTCLKSVETLSRYVTLLKTEGGASRGNIDVCLVKNEVPEKLVNDYKRKDAGSPNAVLPSPNSSILPGTNIILNPFSFYSIIPTSALLPTTQQPATTLQSNFQSGISLSSIPIFQSAANAQLINKSKVHTAQKPGADNFISPPPQLLIINPTPPVESPDKGSLREVQDILNNAESEEMSVLVDPMLFNRWYSDDESDSNFNRIQSDNETNETNQEIESINYEAGKQETEHLLYTCIKCNAAFNKAKDLRAHKKLNFDCRTKYFEKGLKSAVCPKCNGSFCTQQYLQKHILRCNLSKARRKQKKRRVNNKYMQILSEKNIKQDKGYMKVGKNNTTTKNVIDILDSTSEDVDMEVTSPVVEIETNPETLEIERSPNKTQPEAREKSIVFSTPNTDIASTPEAMKTEATSLVIKVESSPETEEIEKYPNAIELEARQKSTVFSTSNEEITSASDIYEKVSIHPDLNVYVKTNKFHCVYCKHQLYECVEHLIQHFSIVHKNIVLFRCQFCNEKFLDGVLLEDHLLGHYNYFKCSKCKETFTDVRFIHFHMSNYHDKIQPVKCVTCNTEFGTNESIIEHSKLHLKNLVFKCHVCNEKYKKIEELYSHIPEHFKNIFCTFCHRKFWSEFELNEHFYFCKKAQSG